MGGPVYESMIDLCPSDIRARIARAEYREGTAGLAPEYVQANLAILPDDLAADFLEFCKSNPKPCPLLGHSRPGEPFIPALGNFDIRTDIPSYNIYRHGRLDGSATEIRDLWRDDFVAFLLGCSLSFEALLTREGIRLAHVERGGIVPMYRTNIETTPAGPFGGSMVVSMRPMSPAEAVRAIEITSNFPAVHGSPVHLSHPEQIGIRDIMRPDWGDVPQVRPGDIPVFWACGVTPQVALERAKPEICITHTPGCMLVTDLPNESLESFTQA